MTHETYLKLLDELAEEANSYLALVSDIKNVAPDSEAYSDLDAELMASVAHLRTHAGMLEASLLEESEAEVAA